MTHTEPRRARRATVAEQNADWITAAMRLQPVQPRRAADEDRADLTDPIAADVARFQDATYRAVSEAVAS